MDNNWTGSSLFLAEHGLAFLIEDCRGSVIHSYLFDTGQRPEILLFNCDIIGVDWGKLRAVMISHGHYDHTGGLMGVSERIKETGARPIPLFYHPEAFTPRVNRNNGSKSIGIPFSKAALKDIGFELVPTRFETEVTGDMILTGEIPRRYPEESESTAGMYLEKEGKLIKDEVTDDRSLILRLPGKGVFLICGCCHAGLINTLEYTKEICKNEKILGIMGGFHMHGAGKKRMELTVDKLKELDPAWIIPMHCTGRREGAVFYKEFDKKVSFAGVGEVIEL